MVRKTVKMMMAGAAVFALMSGSAYAADIVGLITKTNNNPFFVKMKEGAEAKAKELGVTLQSFAGKFDGDNDSQVAAIESLIAGGAKGFMIVPSDSSAIVPTIKKARDAGLMVIVLDTPLDPANRAAAMPCSPRSTPSSTDRLRPGAARSPAAPAKAPMIMNRAITTRRTSMPHSWAAR